MPDGLKLVYDADKESIIEKPDNITLSPNGDLIICEDSGRKTQYLTGLTPEGKGHTTLQPIINPNGQGHVFPRMDKHCLPIFTKILE